VTPLLARRRSERAFERLYRKHLPDVYRYSLALTGNRPDAEDVTQTTFMNAYRAFSRGERPRSPQNWLITIAHNVCRQRVRQSARRPAEVELDADVPDNGRDDETPTPHEISRALAQLGFNQRSALVMRELEGRSYAEIAEAMGLSQSAVEALIFRARRALREQLEGALSCGEVERAISRQLDGRVSRAEKGALRAHLRECEACRTLARRQRAHRSALRGVGLAPVPASLLAGGGAGFAGAGLGAGAGVLVAKAVALAAAGAVAVGVGYEGARLVVPADSARAGAAAPAPVRRERAPAPHARSATVAAAVPTTERPLQHERAPARADGRRPREAPASPAEPAVASEPRARDEQVQRAGEPTPQRARGRAATPGLTRVRDPKPEGQPEKQAKVQRERRAGPEREPRPERKERPARGHGRSAPAIEEPGPAPLEEEGADQATPLEDGAP
jgi:RNA polymerase sigma factor (sigma-70 family)